MNLLCKLFGHRQFSGWWGDGLYGRVVEGGRSGLGTRHLHVTNTCDRCGQCYVQARFHGDPKWFRNAELIEDATSVLEDLLCEIEDLKTEAKDNPLADLLLRFRAERGRN